ncbi:flagellar biosynthetic protein FliO [Chlamydia gallinacea]|uniref:flagellar biosynthetic protein FliO n=1 Tax=Chlamydia gallinacea TaxID=1457153 RepID=UPI00098F18E1|nr:flagellar biosynthetic protein FliO [Chlamydia gallinacea]AQT77389.1 flagellar biosynthetic protein FliO [Chlamydia gallinacea]
MMHDFLSRFLFLSDELALSDSLHESASFQSMFPDNMKVEMLKMLGSLVLVLTLFGIGVWIFKKFLKSKGQSFGNHSTIKILDRRSINPKTCIYLIRVVNKILIIAETNDRITMLSEFPPDTDINALLKNDENKNSFSTSDVLSKSIKKLQRSHSNEPVPALINKE